MRTRNTQLVKANEGGVPDYYRSAGLTGAEEISANDISIPRLKICQGVSKIKGVLKEIKDGEYYNTLTNEVYGPEIVFFPVFFFKSRIWFSEDFQFLASEYFDSKRGEYVRTGDLKVIKESYDSGMDSFNYSIVLEKDLKAGELNFLAFSLTSASLRAGRQLNGKIKYNAANQRPLWTTAVKATTLLQKFQKGQACLPVFSFPEKILSEVEFKKLMELHNLCRDMHEKLAAVEPETHDDGPEHADFSQEPATAGKMTPFKKQF